MSHPGPACSNARELGSTFLWSLPWLTSLRITEPQRPPHLRVPSRSGRAGRCRGGGSGPCGTALELTGARCVCCSPWKGCVRKRDGGGGLGLSRGAGGGGELLRGSRLSIPSLWHGHSDPMASARGSPGSDQPASLAGALGPASSSSPSQPPHPGTPHPLARAAAPSSR